MAKIGADTSGLQSALKDINSSIKSTDSELYNVQKSIKTAEKAGTDRSDLLKQKEDVLGNAISETAEKLEKLRSIEEQMKNASDSGGISADQYRDYQRELANTEAQLRQYQTQLVQTQNEQAGMAGSNQLVVTGLRDVQSAAQNVVNDIKFFTDALADAAQKAVSFSESAVKAALDVGSSFESSMSKVQAYSGASGEAFVKLENAAKDAGANTSKSASEAADALGYMALAGWDTEEMLDGLMPVLRASEAGGADLARTSDLVTDSMSAMGVATSDLTHYLDVCTAAQSNSNTTLTGLLEAYVGCGGTLRNLNVPLEESAALLGTLANRGIKASEAGTSLNSILVNLIGANKSASDAMDALGVSAWDEEGNFIGLSETLKVLKGALEDCTDEQKAFFEAKIGGKTQMDTLQALISGVGDEYDDLYDTLLNANGALEATAKTMQDNLAGAMTTMRSALEALGIEFYDYLEEPAKDAVNAVTEAIRDLTESVDKGKLGDSLANLSEKIADLIEKFAEFASDRGIDLVIDGLENLVDIMSWAADHFDQLVIAVEALGGAFLTLKIVKTVTDIQILITAITTLAGAAEAGSVAAEVLGIAMSAIPAVAVGAAILGVAAAIGTYVVSVNEAEAKTAQMRVEMDKAGESLADTVVAINEVRESIEDAKDKAEDSIAVADRALDSLDDLVDENGNLKDAQYNVDEQLKILNETFGLHLEVIDGQIQGYKDLKTSYEDYCKSLREGAELEAMRPHYIEALGRVKEIDKELETYNQKSEDIAYDMRMANSGAGIDSTIAARWTGTDQYQVWKSFDENKKKDITKDPQALEEFLAWAYRQNQNSIDELNAEKYQENKFIDEYEHKSWGTGENNNTPKDFNPTAYAAQQYGKNVQSQDIEAAQQKADEDFQTMADVLAQLNDLDNNKSLTDMSDEDYYAQLENITEENKSLFSKYTDSDEWKKFKSYLDKVKSYKDKQNKSSSGSGSKSGKSGSTTDPKQKAESEASKNISDKKKSISRQANEQNKDEQWERDQLEQYVRDNVDSSLDVYSDTLEDIKDQNITAAKKEIDTLIQDYEGGKKSLDAVNAEIDGKISHWRDKDTTIADTLSEYSEEKLKNAKAPAKKGKSERETAYDTAMQEVEDKKARHEYKTDSEYKTARNKVQEDYKDISGTSTEWWKNQEDIAKSEFDDLYQQYSDGIIDYKTFIDEYIKLKEKWAKDNIDISEDARSELEKSGEKELSDLKKRFDDEEITYEQYCKGVQDITDKYQSAGITLDPSDDKKKASETETKKGTDAYDDIAEKFEKDLITEEEYQKQKLALIDEYAKKGIDITQYAADKEKEIYQKKLDDINQQIEKSADDIAKKSLGSSGKLYDDKTVSGGGKRKIFTDLNKKANDIKKYTEDLKKLQQTNIPQELMDEILAMDFDDRKEVIKELLKMSEDKRNLYYTDYTNYRAAAKEAASAEYADEKEDIENKLADSADSALESTVDTAGTYGEDAAKAYIDGWKRIMQKYGIDFFKTPAEESAQTYTSTHKSSTAGNNTGSGSSDNKSNTGSNTGNDGKNDKSDSSKGEGDTYISAKQPITINVAGVPVITATIGNILRANGLIGRANSKW